MLIHLPQPVVSTLQLQGILQSLLPNYTYASRNNAVIVGNGLCTGVIVKQQGPQTLSLGWEMPNMAVKMLWTMSMLLTGILPGLIVYGIIYAVVNGGVSEMQLAISQAMTTGVAVAPRALSAPGGNTPVAATRPGAGLAAAAVLLALFGTFAGVRAVSQFDKASRGAERLAAMQAEESARTAAALTRAAQSPSGYGAASQSPYATGYGSGARYGSGSSYGTGSSYASRYGSSYGSTSSYRYSDSAYQMRRAGEHRTGGFVAIVASLILLGLASAMVVIRSNKIKEWQALQSGRATTPIHTQSWPQQPSFVPAPPANQQPGFAQPPHAAPGPPMPTPGGWPQA